MTPDILTAVKMRTFLLRCDMPRYYLLEDRALQGMLVACEPRSLGRGPSAESALAGLRRPAVPCPGGSERLRQDLR
jgi:hypothetical protein